MRGYGFLKKSESLNKIANVNREFANHSLSMHKICLASFVFGEGAVRAELVCRQYLLSRIAGLKLNRALLYALGKPGSKVVYYLPPEWRKIIRKQGFEVACFRTAVLWTAFVSVMLAYGVFKIARIILIGIKAAHKESNRQLGRYIYFIDFVPKNLPQVYGDTRSYDIITWYMQWDGRIADIDALCHGGTGVEEMAVGRTKVVPVQEPIPLLSCFGSLRRFIAWGVWVSLFATWEFLHGRWWYALLLSQSALAAQVRFQKPKRLAKEYLFNLSALQYRPMWTYEAEKRGARITFYFYSTNCEGFKRTDGYPPPHYAYQMMSWSHYLVWDEYQADFVRRVVGETAKISVVGSIWFNSSAEGLPAFEGRGVAVFDVTPHRASRYRTLGSDFEYYIPETCLPFLSDIQKVTNDAGYMMMWKRKRKIGSIAHPHYRCFAEHLKTSKNVMTVDPDISAYRVIEASTAVISMPFTSTALIARELGKPSCYYDPTDMIQKDDRAGHGIDIISGPEELRKWFKKLPVETDSLM